MHYDICNNTRASTLLLLLTILDTTQTHPLRKQCQSMAFARIKKTKIRPNGPLPVGLTFV